MSLHLGQASPHNNNAFAKHADMNSVIITSAAGPAPCSIPLPKTNGVLDILVFEVNSKT